MPPQHVKAYVKTNKHEAADAEACCARRSAPTTAVGAGSQARVQRPGMRFVPIKSTTQQALLMLHRVRDQLMGQRTATINALRAHLAELGIVAAQRQAGVRQLLAVWPTSGTSASRRWRVRCCRCWRRSCATLPTGSPSFIAGWSR
jgi:transposase